ncbi:MAG: ISLre2 family transposase [Verrucomicrobia bacterium]|nr:ISLre2 family transposase [Verrucomicrobiota bacterium]
MEKIIAQIITELAKKICQKVFSSEWKGLSELVSWVKKECLKTAVAVVEECIRAINQEFQEKKALRKELGLTVKEKNQKREIVTELGTINISRDCYWSKKEQRCVHPLDELLGVERYERVDKAVKTKLVWAASDKSYQKSADEVTEGAVSRQTVRNAILTCKEDLEIQAPKEKRQTKELHIHADEDHVHMQKAHKEKGKKNQMVPLVSVTEGSRPVCKGRNETINPVHFVDKDFDPKGLWMSVEGYLLKAYKMEDVGIIYLHGDGGAWIKDGLSDFPNVIHVMDQYHSEKEIKRIDSLFPRKTAGWRLRETLRQNNLKKAKMIIESLESATREAAVLDKLKGFSKYLENNWEALVRRYQGDLPGSCTEGQVSHVLSERFSRNPMGWSSEALSKLSKVRIYRKNGGDPAEILNRSPQKTTHAQYYEDALLEDLGARLDWSVFEKQLPIYDTNSGTQRLIRAIGKAG